MFFKKFFQRLERLEKCVSDLEASERSRAYDRIYGDGRPDPLTVALHASNMVDRLAEALGYTYEASSVKPARYVRKGQPEQGE